MREVLARSLDATNVPHLLARPSQEEPSGVVVWSEIAPIRETLNTKIGVTELEAAINQIEAMMVQLEATIALKIDSTELEQGLVATIKEFPLVGGTAEIRVSTEDGQEYTYTTFEFSTGFGSLAFKSFDLSESLDPYTKGGYSYIFQKFGVDSARVIFESAIGQFPDNRVSVALIRIPSSKVKNEFLPQGALIDSTNFTASAFHSVRPPANAFDKNPSTSWSAEMDQRPGDWFRFDMGKVEQLSRIEVDGTYYHYVRLLKISGSNNNQDWTEIKTVEGSFGTTIAIFDNPVNYRFIELACAQEHGDNWAFVEIRVFS